jgi:hypothetical protein
MRTLFVSLFASLSLVALGAAGHRVSPSPVSVSTSVMTPAPAPIVITGTVGGADKGTYQEYPFTVPGGVTRIDVEFSYENEHAGTELEIGLFDPQRFRGTSRFSKSRFHVSDMEATPSYMPGPLVAGIWRVSLGIPSMKAGTTGTWRVTIHLSTEPSPREGLGPVLKTAAGWYVGDLHAHTLHSDGFGCDDAAAHDPTPASGAAPAVAAIAETAAPGAVGRRGCQPWEVVEAARARHLDFLAITDHNTTSHHADLATLQEGLTSLLLLRGQELTTFHGHANVYGTSRVIDFRLGFRGRSMRDVMDDVEQQGALLSINHPGRDTGDRCTGCGWDAPETPWDRVTAIEVVNGGIIEGRIAGMPFWYARLNEGHRLTGIGGSDDHAARSAHGRIGAPATVVYARELSEAALLDGIRSGRVYVRTRGPEGPSLDLTATLTVATPMPGDHAAPIAMGDTLQVPQAADAAAASGNVRLDLRIGNAAGQQAEIVRNGDVVATLPIATNDAALTQVVTLTAGQWVHVRVRDAKGLTAFTNPVYATAEAIRSAATRSDRDATRDRRGRSR